MVPQRRGLSVQLKMVEPTQQWTLVLELGSPLELIPRALLEELWRLSVPVGWRC